MRIQLAAAALAVSFAAQPADPADTAAAGQPALSILHSFCADPGCTDGAYLWSGVVQGPDGSFYGTTFGGGDDTPYNGQDYGVGVVYRLTRGGQFSVLHTFNATTEGAYPQAGLSVGSDGYLYGATTQGGAAGGGCVFRISTAGEFTLVHAFGAGEGFEAYAPPIQDAAGNLYGTTMLGGANGVGTVYKIAADGSFTTLHDFTGLTDGADPAGGLLQGRDGNFYGTTSVDGGDYGLNGGTVFRITPTGTLTTLHVFTYVDGADPEKTLALGPDGAFYGTTTVDGPADGAGTVFRITAKGSLSTLYSFPGPTVQGSPTSGLTLGADGNFYGVQANVGTYSKGQIFRISTSGTFAVVQAIGATKSGGAYPEASLALGRDGKLYGTTLDGGQDGDGTVFAFEPPAVSD